MAVGCAQITANKVNPKYAIYAVVNNTSNINTNIGLLTAANTA
jgi:hypothetical protein